MSTKDDALAGQPGEKGGDGPGLVGDHPYQSSPSPAPAPTDDETFVLADHVYMEAPDDADYRTAPTDDVAPLVARLRLLHDHIGPHPTANEAADALERLVADLAQMKRNTGPRRVYNRDLAAARAVIDGLKEEIGVTREEHMVTIVALRRQVAAVRALHQQYRPAHHDEFDVCSECSRYLGDLGVPWPCPTVAALDTEKPATPTEEES